jgi:hypothetical protein
MPTLVPQPTPGKVKCANCGRLSLRSEGGAIIEADQDFRLHAAPLGGRYTATSHSELLPFCLDGYADLFSEIIASPYYGTDPPTSTQVSILETLHKERACAGYVEWRRGSTPKEHREMLDRQWMHEQEERRRTSDRRWHIGEIVLLTAIAAAYTIYAGVLSRGTSNPQPIFVPYIHQAATPIPPTLTPATVTPIPPPIP